MLVPCPVVCKQYECELLSVSSAVCRADLLLLLVTL